MAQCVLIVDDDMAIRETLRFLLEDEGYEALEAADAQAALDQLRASPVRLVALVDHLMPALSGLGLLQHIARDEDLRARHAYVLMSASSKFDALEHELAQLPSPDVAAIRKPFELDDLLAAVRAAEQRLAMS